MVSILSHLNNFHQLEVVDHVSETQLRVCENFHLIIWRLKHVKVCPALGENILCAAVQMLI